ncbi:putative DUF74 family protein [Besnoitia besnoiti]|uniref:Putative DUF74 family protein n=1 Tax=Besnoitia besnoiti TaxID=94643 RepID=A0A2A9M8U7_BESBE|nr:putative DUF74 family protein [Besnoitia besnoiti]PFH32326.1 putative DUF74 family protein [Besnoitia besnoiti]
MALSRNASYIGKKARSLIRDIVPRIPKVRHSWPSSCFSAAAAAGGLASFHDGGISPSSIGESAPSAPLSTGVVYPSVTATASCTSMFLGFFRPAGGISAGGPVAADAGSFAVNRRLTAPRGTAFYECQREQRNLSLPLLLPQHCLTGVDAGYTYSQRGFSSYADFSKQLRGKYTAKQQEGRREKNGASHATQAEERVLEGMQENGAALPKTASGEPILVSTTPTVPGYSIKEYKGLVQGCSVRSRDVLRMAKVVLMVQFGGEMGDLTALISRVKAEAVNRMRDEAVALGANAVVGVRIVSSGTHQRVAVEFSAYGTAVVVKEV